MSTASFCVEFLSCVVCDCLFLLLAALQALKRKQRYAKQLQQIDGTLSTVEFQREALENATTNTEVLKVMGDAAKALKSAHKNMCVLCKFFITNDIVLLYVASRICLFLFMRSSFFHIIFHQNWIADISSFSALHSLSEV